MKKKMSFTTSTEDIATLTERTNYMHFCLSSWNSLSLNFDEEKQVNDFDISAESIDKCISEWTGNGIKMKMT